ncbi:unnamed protein product [Rotaria sp. Silwood2]|nr:unnamed protein product [Rotaria sp. Silwood2]CAF2615349.1 unnamed protein product [Rotaria sp. Silwood2]CAF3008293.1 unnamed protein product [Rotaria sp. Silwood2]CAF4123197.1 unnamed protein product [Rotaria sp. Silwood2]CAF4156914.1 unnamed protein product [Rotaria sp. Silwood2]
MGLGSSVRKVRKFDKSSQMPPIIYGKPPPERSLSISSAKPRTPLFTRVSPKPPKQQTITQDDIFEVEDNIEEYSTIWDDDAKLTSTFHQSLKSNVTKIDYNQKESFNTKGSKKASATFGSSHIESTVDTQTHSCINISSSEKVDELMITLNQVHTQLDEKIKIRTEKISNETELLLSRIRNETQQEQQRLLGFAKQQEMQQDDNYQKLLQEYITKLDEMKAKELTTLQKRLQTCRDQIIEKSQFKLIRVNEQANIIKAKIVQEEQHYSEEKIDSIMSQIYRISTDEKLQHLGSEIVTKTNVTTQAKFGTKAPGQECTHDFDQNK